MWGLCGVHPKVANPQKVNRTLPVYVSLSSVCIYIYFQYIYISSIYIYPLCVCIYI